MLFLGHVGITLGAGWAFQAAGRRGGDGARGLRAVGNRLDLRWLMAGSMLPDAIDKTLMLAFPASAVGSGRTIAHSLLFVVVVLLVGLTLRSRAKAVLLTVGAASLGHLALDSMWNMPHTLLWPALGWSFEPLHVGDFVGRILHGLETSPAVYIPEALGAAISLAFAARLLLARRVRRFLLAGSI
ncbi:MAG: metal-dependent hydrolase [Chloroflexi bacterium]|nr:metal-dependent hydrolase [Chloroflexota bacterium]